MPSSGCTSVGTSVGIDIDICPLCSDCVSYRACGSLNSQCIVFHLYTFHADIDECAENTDGCEQMCTDTDGSFECSCGDGFSVSSDGKSCDGECAPEL